MTAPAGSIVYADRDADARQIIGRFLGRTAEVRSVETCAAMRREVMSDPPLLLVVDPALDDGDATTVVREAIAAHPWMQVFVLCSPGAAARTSEFIAAGATDVAVKPFDVGTLVGRATRALRAAEVARRELHYRRELEARLEHIERIATLGTLCATVAHEIANPLALVTANGEVLARRLQVDAPFSSAERNALLEATEDIQTAARLIDAFLSRVRVFSRRRDDERVNVSLASVLDTALLFTKPRIVGTAVTLGRPTKSAPVVPHFRVRMTQALLNLLTNAVEAIGERGSVTVEFEDMADAVAIVVEDDGPGLSPDARRHLFQPFFTTKPQGTGLGLVLVQTVMREHGGLFELEARPIQGTRARLVLPKN